MSIRWSDVVCDLPAPGLSALGAGATDDIIAVVLETVNADVFGGTSSARYRRACLLLAAYHGQVTVDATANVAGPVTSKSADGLSKSYATTAIVNDPSALAANAWGRAFLAMARSSPKARLGLVA